MLKQQAHRHRRGSEPDAGLHGRKSEVGRGAGETPLPVLHDATTLPPTLPPVPTPSCFRTLPTCLHVDAVFQDDAVLHDDVFQDTAALHLPTGGRSTAPARLLHPARRRTGPPRRGSLDNWVLHPHISIYSGEASPQYWQGWPPANNSLLNIGYR